MIIEGKDLSYCYKVWILNWRGKNSYRSLDLKNLISSFSNALVICGGLIDNKRLNDCYKEAGFNLFRVWEVQSDPFFQTWQKTGGIFRITLDLHRELVSKYMLFGTDHNRKLIEILQKEFFKEIRERAKDDNFDKDYMDIQEQRNRNQLVFLKPEKYKTIADKYWSLTSNLDNRLFINDKWCDVKDPFVYKKQLGEEL